MFAPPLLVACLVAGCSGLPVNRVYVDIDSVWAARQVRPEEIGKVLDTPPKVPKRPTALDLPVEAILEPIGTTPADLAQLEHRRQIALEETAKLRAKLEADLREQANRGVAREERRSRAELTAQADDQADAIYHELRRKATQLAIEYAEIKFPLLLHRAVLKAAGRKDLTWTHRQELLTETEKKLSDIDENQQTLINQLQTEASRQVSGAYANVEQEVARLVQEVLAKRLKDIEDSLRSENFDVRLVLSDKPLTPELTAIRQVLVLQPPPALPAITPPRRSLRAQWEVAGRDELKQEIRLWARTKGYTLVANRAFGRDVTNDYIKEFGL